MIAQKQAAIFQRDIIGFNLSTLDLYTFERQDNLDKSSLEEFARVYAFLSPSRGLSVPRRHLRRILKTFSLRRSSFRARRNFIFTLNHLHGAPRVRDGACGL